MIGHVLKVVWRRKTQNVLLLAEIFISFVVVLAVSTFAIHLARNLGSPLGYEIDRVYRASYQEAVWESGTAVEESRARVAHMLEAVRSLPEVESAELISMPPYNNGRSMENDTLNGRDWSVEVNEAGDDLPRTLGLRLVSGRWFSRQDDGAADTPVVLNAQHARFLFGHADAVGELLPVGDDDRKSGTVRRRRVIGVVSDFRRAGEIEAPANYLFTRVDLAKAERMPGSIMVRVWPGVGPDEEERLSRTLLAAAKGWAVEVMPLREVREASLRLSAVPLVVLGVVAGFLLLMVALGLTGVLWQSVTRRTSEIGLRRALGAPEGAILRQVVGEIAAVSLAAAALGGLLALQVPLLDLFGGGARPGTYAAGFAVSTLLLLLLTTACALYPGRLAMRVSPVSALRYE